MNKKSRKRPNIPRYSSFKAKCRRIRRLKKRWNIGPVSFNLKEGVKLSPHQWADATIQVLMDVVDTMKEIESIPSAADLIWQEEEENSLSA
jgi:hypothetical protein